MNFENLINQPESSILDFKADLYDFSNANNHEVTAKFIKDIVSFGNTIRNEDAFIVFGVKVKTKGDVELIGISKSIDDAILQEKVKDKVIPRPIFSYSTIKYEDKTFGIIKIPVVKYEFPIIPTVKMKGLETGKVYYRNGSSNTEAGAIDAIRINDWLKTLPGQIHSGITDEISNLLKRLSANEEKLSTILSDVFSLSKKYNLKALKDFAISELQGTITEIKKGKHRSQIVLVSIFKVDFKPNMFTPITAYDVKRELEKHENFYEYKALINYPIVKIEELISQFKSKKNSAFIILEKSSKDFFEFDDEVKLYLYIFEANLLNVYANIRQKVIDELMRI